MHEIKHIPPERMTPESRLREVGALLANGLLRLRTQIGEGSKYSKVQLGFCPEKSVHSNDLNNPTESL